MSDFFAIQKRIFNKMAARHTLGLFDCSPYSWEDRLSNARALRIVLRLRGKRISLREALHG